MVMVYQIYRFIFCMRCIAHTHARVLAPFIRGEELARARAFTQCAAWTKLSVIIITSFKKVVK